MNHNALRQSIEQVDGKGGVHLVEKGKKQLTGEQGWSHAAEGIEEMAAWAAPVATVA
jgi:hypothetical protein